jgi:hypothetical protein
MRQLSSFLLLPLLFVLARASADTGPRSTAETLSRGSTGGTFRRTVSMLVRRTRAVSRLFVPRTVSEMQTIAAAVKAETKTTRRPPSRRRASRATTARTLSTSPRVRPQTT